MPGRPVSLAEVVLSAIDSRLDEVHVARPGEVTAYDAATNTAVVKPAIKRALFNVETDERSYEDLPEIPFVPVIFPRVGDFALTLPVTVGTPVLLLFCDVSLAEWRESGKVAEPTDARRHSIGWPVALVGLYPDTSPMSSDPIDVLARTAGMVIGRHGADARIEISPSEIRLGKGATDFVALASLISSELSNLRTWLNGHIHTSAAAGSPTTAPVAPILAFGSVAATLTRAK